MAITGKKARNRSFAAFGHAVRRSIVWRASSILLSLAYTVLFTTPSLGQTWRITPLFGVEETLTNNVQLEPNGVRRGDLVTQLTPGFRVLGTGARSRLEGTVELPTLLYARLGSENNRVEPQINLVGKWEAVERFFFVDASANVSQQYLTPLGTRSESLANETGNRFTSQAYSVSPNIRSGTGDYSLTLRDNNIWSKGDNSAVAAAYTNELVGTLERRPTPVGWAVDVDRASTKFQDQSTQLIALVRARGLYQWDPQVRFSVAGGYEHNNLLVDTNNSIIYGGGVSWRPTERSLVDAYWEHRFFGGSYRLTIENRTPLSTWSVVASRNIATYPEQLAALPAGVTVSSELNSILQSRIPDAAQRQRFVDQLIASRGLPSVLTGPVNVYSDQVTLYESVIATAGLLGARNSLFFNAYRNRQQPISGTTSLPPDLAALQNNTQYGANVVWSHNLTPLVTLNASIEASRTVDNAETGATRWGAVRAGIASPIGPFTRIYGNLRYQVQRSNVASASDYNEAALIVGITHEFH